MNRYILFALLVGSVLRLVDLGKIPVSLSVDEVSIGYNAYSILKTGKDQYKRYFPLVFESLGDFKPPLYIYATSVSEFFFGLTEFAVRLPAALSGIMAIWLTYLITKSLTDNSKIALASAVVLAILPWHIRLSRGAYEASFAFTLMLAAYYYLIEFRNLALGGLLGAASFFTYHVEKLFSPLFIVGMILVYRKQLRSGKFAKKLVVCLGIMGLCLLWVATNKAGKDRAINTFVWNDVEIRNVLSFDNSNIWIGKFYLIASTVVNRYLQYFDPTYYFVNGSDLLLDNKIDFGNGHLHELILFIIGISLLIKRRDVFKNKEAFVSFLIWTILSPIPASLTLNDYHPIRSLTLAFSYSVVVGIGLMQIFKNKNLIPKAIVSFLYALSLVRFVDYYGTHSQIQKSDQSFDPSSKVALSVLRHESQFSKVILDPSFGKQGPNIIGAPEMYILFYGKIDPHHYWSSLHTDGFDKYYVSRIDWSRDRGLSRTLFAGSTWSLPEKDIKEDNILERISFENGIPAYMIVKSDDYD